MKSPIANLLPLIVKAMLEKSGLPTMAAIRGVSKSLTNPVTTTECRAHHDRYCQIKYVTS